MKRIKTPVLLGILTLFTASLSCSSGVLEESNKRATERAVAEQATQVHLTVIAVQTQVALQGATTTPTPDCLFDVNPFGDSPCLIEDEDVATPTPQSFGTFTITGSTLWVRYHSSLLTQQLVVRRGTSWPGTASGFFFEGWLPDFDLVFDNGGESGITRCDRHRWDHRGRTLLSHTHIIGDASTQSNIDVLAQIGCGLKFTVTSEGVTSRWTRDKDGNAVFTPGHFVRVEEEVSVDA